MGIDCTYQGIPYDPIIFDKAKSDADYSQNVFFLYSKAASRLEKYPFFHEKEFDSVRKYFIDYPEIINWNFSPVSRMHDAVIYVLSPDNYVNSKTYEELEKSFQFKFVKGELVFSEHLVSSIGIPVRVSSPSFIKECVDFAESIDIDRLSSNFNAHKMNSIHVYKVSPETTFESTKNYLRELIEFYKRISLIDDVWVFVSEN